MLGPLALRSTPRRSYPRIIADDPCSVDHRVPRHHRFGRVDVQTPTIDTGALRSPPLALGVLIVLLLATVLTGCGGGAPTETSLPEIAVSDLSTGRPATLAAEGTPLVINLWASWCTPCRTEMPAFQRVHEQLGDRVTLVGVTDETELDAARRVAAETEVSYPLLVDEDQRLLIDLGVAGLPGTVFIDGDGQVVGRHLGVLTEDELLREIEDHYDIAV